MLRLWAISLPKLASASSAFYAKNRAYVHKYVPRYSIKKVTYVRPMYVGRQVVQWLKMRVKPQRKELLVLSAGNQFEGFEIQLVAEKRSARGEVEMEVLQYNTYPRMRFDVLTIPRRDVLQRIIPTILRQLSSNICRLTATSTTTCSSPEGCLSRIHREVVSLKSHTIT